MVPLGDLRWGALGRCGSPQAGGRCPRHGPFRRPESSAARPSYCLAGRYLSYSSSELAAPFGDMRIAGFVVSLLGLSVHLGRAAGSRRTSAADHGPYLEHHPRGACAAAHCGGTCASPIIRHRPPG